MLYVPSFLFNLLSISCLTRFLGYAVSFTKDSIFLQNRSSGRMIGTGCESHGHYLFSSPSRVYSVKDNFPLFMLNWVILALPNYRSWCRARPSCIVYLVSRVNLRNIPVVCFPIESIIKLRLLLLWLLWCLGSYSHWVFFRFQVFCHFHWWLFTLHLVIFNEK